MSLANLQSSDTVGLSDDERTIWEPASKQTETGEAQVIFDKWLGYYKTIPELSVIDKLADWVVYGGDDTDDKLADITFERKTDEEKFKRWTGYGKDTPRAILHNLFRVGKICGTTTAEIMRGNKQGVINIKPLDPGIIKVHTDEKGILTKFEVISRKPAADGTMEKAGTDLSLDKLFYIAWNRIADEIVGISTIEKLQTILDYRHQAMEDLAEVFHRYVVPFWIFYVDENDTAEIDKFKTKVKKMIQSRDHLVVPDESVKKHERLAVPQFASLDPLNWIKHLERYFLLSEGVPELIAGIGRETADASSRMIYLAWRVVTIANQKKYEEQIETQLGIKLKLPRPINILAPEITERRTQVLGSRKEGDTKQHEEVNN
jgi:hypothetical protein